VRRAALALAAALAGCAGDEAGRAYLQGYRAAEAAGTPFAPVTDRLPAASLSQAYRLQHRLVAARVRGGDRVAGYKGGLMSAASLKARGVAEPLAGVLFASGRVAAGGTASLCGYRKASLELKLGYLLGAGIARATDAVSVRRAVTAVVPVIDLPDIGYQDPDLYGAVDMAAANVSAFRFVQGGVSRPDAHDLDALPVALARDGREMARGVGRESLGDQWASLATVLRVTRAAGYRPAEGDLVITGKIGDRIWLIPGRYRADYGPLGAVPFTVEACTRR